jgi:hypothetical protein
MTNWGREGSRATRRRDREDYPFLIMLVAMPDPDAVNQQFRYTKLAERIKALTVEPLTIVAQEHTQAARYVVRLASALDHQGPVHEWSIVDLQNVQDIRNRIDELEIRTPLVLFLREDLVRFLMADCWPDGAAREYLGMSDKWNVIPLLPLPLNISRRDNRIRFVVADTS